MSQYPDAVENKVLPNAELVNFANFFVNNSGYHGSSGTLTLFWTGSGTPLKLCHLASDNNDTIEYGPRTFQNCKMNQ